MKCTEKEQETCEVEKRGCEGCFYNGSDKDVAQEMNIEDLKSELEQKEVELEKYVLNKENDYLSEEAEQMRKEIYNLQDKIITLESYSDTNVGDIEKDLQRLNELTKPEHANWMGLSNQKAIRHLVAEVRRLIKERDGIYADYQDLGKEYYNSIPKDKIKELINYLKEVADFTRTDDSYISQIQAGVMDNTVKKIEELLKESVDD